MIKEQVRSGPRRPVVHPALPQGCPLQETLTTRGGRTLRLHFRCPRVALGRAAEFPRAPGEGQVSVSGPEPRRGPGLVEETGVGARRTVMVGGAASDTLCAGLSRRTSGPAVPQSSYVPRELGGSFSATLGWELLDSRLEIPKIKQREGGDLSTAVGTPSVL